MVGAWLTMNALLPRSRESKEGSFMGSVVLHTTVSQRGAVFWRDALGYVSSEDNAEFLVPTEWTPPSRMRHDHG